jgi:hypothetical protein
MWRSVVSLPKTRQVDRQESETPDRDVSGLRTGSAGHRFGVAPAYANTLGNRILRADVGGARGVAFPLADPDRRNRSA